MKGVAELFRKNGIHYAWVVMIACIIFYGAVVGALYNVRGIFYTAICADTGWNYSVFNISTIVMGLSSFAVSGLVARSYSAYPVRRVLFITAFVYCLTHIARAFMKSVAAFSVLSAVMGAAAAFLIYVPVPLIINNWFIKYKGLALGCTTLSSGLFAAVTSPIWNIAIENMGWQRASILNGLVSMLTALPVILIFISGRPEELGLKPLGFREETDILPSDAAYREDSEKETEYIPSKEALDAYNGRYPEKKRKQLAFLCVIYVVLGGFISGYNASISSHALSLGLTAAIGAAATALCNFSNMLGKVLGGVCADHFGLKKTVSAILILGIAGMMGMIFGGQSHFLFYSGSFAIGLLAFNSTNAPSMLLGTFCTGDEYLKNVVRNSKGIMLTNAFVTFLPGLMLDIFGSNTVTCLLYSGFLLISLIILYYILRK